MQSFREPHCNDYDGYQQSKTPPNFINKGFRRVWPEDEDMMNKLKCLDDCHSRERCITEEHMNELEDDLTEYAANMPKPLCDSRREDIEFCLNKNQKLLPCEVETTRFIDCVNKTVAKIYANSFEQSRR